MNEILESAYRDGGERHAVMILACREWGGSVYLFGAKLEGIRHQIISLVWGNL